MIFDPSAILAASIPAVFALLGVIVANWWTFRQQVELFERDQRARRQELSLQRGEELYILTDKYLVLLAKNYLSLTGVMRGRLSYPEYLDLMSKESPDGADFTRMQMLVAVHFPSLLPSFQNILNAREQLNDTGTRFVKTLTAGSQDNPQIASEYISRQRALETAGEQFQKDIAEHLRQFG